MYLLYRLVVFLCTRGAMGTQGESLAQELGGLPGFASICCVASGKWLILAFICKMMTQMSPHPAVKFHF